MKTVLFALCAFIFAPLAIAASEFKEGVEYTVVKETATATPEVTEFFSYVCPHCYSFEPLIKGLEERLPDAEINKVPVGFLGRDMGPVLQKAYAAARLLEVEDKMTPVIFDSIHRQKKMPQSMDDVKALFVSNGVAENRFDGVINSFALNGLVAQYDKTTETYNVRGTPTIVVNGKYQLNMEKIGSEERFYRVVEHLLSTR